MRPRLADSSTCPTEVTLTETPQPYREGSYVIDGTASLSWLAQAFKIDSSDRFSVTWVANLQPKYQNCQASARITKINNESFQGHSQIRMRFINKKAYLILDMTGIPDANEMTSVILKKGVKNGNPTWSWGGTD